MTWIAIALLPSFAARADPAQPERYFSEEQIETDRQKDLKLVEFSIGRARRELTTAREERARQLQNEIDFYMNRPLPEDLTVKIKANERIQQDAQKTIKVGEEMERRVNAKYDDILMRYRELKSGKRR